MPAGTVPMVNNLFQGMPLDPATGLYYERARWYSSARAVLRQEPKSRYPSGAVHREISQDPAGYINGANTYQFVGSDPVGYTDPTGTAAGTYRPSYRTTQRPTADHNGRFGPWRIQWDIHPAPTVPPQGTGAYVVQKIHVTIHVADARTHQVLQQDAVDKTYWEAHLAVLPGRGRVKTDTGT